MLDTRDERLQTQDTRLKRKLRDWRLEMGEWLVSTEGRRQCLLIGKKIKRMSYGSERTFIPYKHFQRKKTSEDRSHLLTVQLRDF